MKTASTVYGAVSSDYNGVMSGGIYQIGTDMSLTRLNRIYNNYNLMGMAIRNGKVCGYYSEIGIDEVKAGYIECNLDGSDLRNTPLSVEGYGNCVQYFTYNPLDDTFFGYTYSDAGDRVIYFQAPGDNPSAIREICDATELYKAMTVNQYTGQTVGIDESGRLIEIDPATGNTEIIAETGIRNDYFSGLCYSPVDDGYLYTTFTTDENYDYVADLYLISDGNYEAEQLGRFKAPLSFMGLFCTDAKSISPEAPGVPQVVSHDFGRGSTSGTITWKIPSATVSGNTLSSTLTYTALVDNEVYKTGSTAAGGELTVSYSDLSQGRHKFSLFVADGDKESDKCVYKLYVGFDTPVAPSGVTIDSDFIRWEPVTAGVNGGYIDPEALTYNIFLNGNKMAENISGTSWRHNIGADIELASYIAGVEAVNHGNVSKTTSSEAAILGKALNLPVSLPPTEAQASLFTVIDNNADLNTWELTEGDEDGEYLFRYMYSYSEPGDDYLILPPADFTDAKAVYEFSFDARCMSSATPEAYEIYIGQGTDAASMHRLVAGPVTVANTEAQRRSCRFTVPAAGAYNLAIKCVSAPSQYALIVSDFGIEKSPLSLDSPVEVSGLTANACPKGELAADVSFTFPTHDFSGNALDPSKTLYAVISSSVDTKSVTGKPGATAAVRIATVQGLNSVSVTVSGSADASGVASGTTVFTGNDIPGKVNNLSMSTDENGTLLNMSWEAPSETGVNGGYVNPSDLSYNIVEFGDYGMEIKWTVDAATTQMSFEVPGNQRIVQYGVVTANPQGVSEEVAMVHDVAGTPYVMPLKETIPDNFTYEPFSIEDGNTLWGINYLHSLLDSSVSSRDKTVLFGRASALGLKSEVLSPMICTEDDAPAALTIDYYATPGADVKCYGYTLGKERVFIGDLTTEESGEGYTLTKRTFELPEALQHHKWVRISFQTNFDDYGQQFILNGYTMRESYLHNLTVERLAGPAELHVDNPATFRATVCNNGTGDMTARGLLTVTDASEKTLFEKETAESPVLKQDDSYVFDIDMNPTAALGEQANVTFRLLTDDEQPADNSSALSVAVSTHGSMTVNDLHGTIADNTVNLSWTAPQQGTRYTGFEQEEAFVDNPQTIAGFTNIDRDGEELCEFYMWTVPNLGKPQGWFVWDVDSVNAITGTEYIPRIDGRNIIAAASITDKKADDWLISPAVKGGSKVSFYAREVMTNFGDETIEVLYSDAGTDIADFKTLKTIIVGADEQLGLTGLDWRKYEVELPGDARHFALRYISNDVFGILIDALEWTADSDAGNVQYHVYRDGVRIGTTADNHYADSFTDSDFKGVYYVVPVIDGREGEKSNELFVSATGISSVANGYTVTTGAGRIDVTGAEGRKIEIFSVAGLKMAGCDHAADRETFRLASGVYIVTVDGKPFKVILR